MHLQQLILILESVHAHNAIVFPNGQIRIIWGETTRHFQSETELLAALEVRSAGFSPTLARTDDTPTRQAKACTTYNPS